MGKEEEDDGNYFFLVRRVGLIAIHLKPKMGALEDFSVHLGLSQWIGFGFGKQERNKRTDFFAKTSNKA